MQEVHRKVALLNKPELCLLRQCEDLQLAAHKLGSFCHWSNCGSQNRQKAAARLTHNINPPELEHIRYQHVINILSSYTRRHLIRM